MSIRVPMRPQLVAVDRSFTLVPRPRALRTIARMFGGFLVAIVLALAFVPWQQSVRGTGRVIAFAPLDRQQEIKATFSGRVVAWHVQEGQRVTAGQLLATLEDNDPLLPQRLEQARNSASDRLQSSREAVRVYGDQVNALVASRTAAVSAADHRVAMANDRVLAAERSLDSARASETAAKQNLDRQKVLESEGLSSTRTLELAQAGATSAKADTERAQATLRAARSEVSSVKAERDRTNASTAAEIERARASLQSARMDLAGYEAALQDREIETARQKQREITAPRDGVILSQLVKQGGEYVSAGAPIATLVPSGGARAAEVWVDGRDAPLVTPGRVARLQFEGWPAVQFIGWPSTAVGTFGGQVAFVDAAANVNGQFRVVVVPREGDNWPDEHVLRQGARVNGWVLLDQVKIGYELWRLWNGFPPSTTPPAASDARDTSSVKASK